VLEGRAPVVPPSTTALGSVLAYVTDRARRDFQPMNANYGLFPPLPAGGRGKEKRAALGERARAELARWIQAEAVEPPAGTVVPFQEERRAAP